MEAILGVGLIAIAYGVYLAAGRRRRAPLREPSSYDIARVMSKRREKCKCNWLLACEEHSRELDKLDTELRRKGL